MRKPLLVAVILFILTVAAIFAYYYEVLPGGDVYFAENSSSHTIRVPVEAHLVSAEQPGQSGIKMETIEGNWTVVGTDRAVFKLAPYGSLTSTYVLWIRREPDHDMLRIAHLSSVIPGSLTFASAWTSAEGASTHDWSVSSWDSPVLGDRKVLEPVESENLTFEEDYDPQARVAKWVMKSTDGNPGTMSSRMSTESEVSGSRMTNGTFRALDLITEGHFRRDGSKEVVLRHVWYINFSFEKTPMKLIRLGVDDVNGNVKTEPTATHSEPDILIAVFSEEWVRTHQTRQDQGFIEVKMPEDTFNASFARDPVYPGLIIHESVQDDRSVVIAGIPNPPTGFSQTGDKNVLFRFIANLSPVYPNISSLYWVYEGRNLAPPPADWVPVGIPLQTVTLAPVKKIIITPVGSQK